MERTLFSKIKQTSAEQQLFSPCKPQCKFSKQGAAVFFTGMFPGKAEKTLERLLPAVPESPVTAR